MGQPVDTARTTILDPPPLSAFRKLLVDSDDDVSLRRLLKKYPAPEKQHRLLQHLQGFQYNHQLDKTTARSVSRARAWFNKRKRWRTRVSKLDQELTVLLVEFAEGPLYPLLRASDRLSKEYDREVDHIFEAIKQLGNSVKSSAILSGKFTTRGHQAQPSLQHGVTALRRADGAGPCRDAISRLCLPDLCHSMAVRVLGILLLGYVQM